MTCVMFEKGSTMEAAPTRILTPAGETATTLTWATWPFARVIVSWLIAGRAPEVTRAAASRKRSCRGAKQRLRFIARDAT